MPSTNQTVGYALTLNGQDTFLAMPAAAAYNFGTGDFTVQAWLRARRAGTVISRKSTAGGGGNGGWLLVLNPNATFKLATDDGFGYYEVISALTSAMDGNWHHVAALRQNGQLAIYFDGYPLTVTVGTNRFTPLDVSNNLRLLVGFIDQNQEKNKYLGGDINQIQLWNYARSQAEIYASMYRSAQLSDNRLVGLWDFSDQTGKDGSSLHNNGTFSGSVSFTSPSYIPTDIPLAVYLSGNQQSYVSIPTNDAYNVGTGDFSVQAWIHAESPGTVISRKPTAGGSNDGGWLLVLQPDGGFKLATDDGIGFYQVISQPTAALDGQWHSVAAVRRAGVLNIYVDGALIPSTASTDHAPPSTPLNIDSSTPIYIGATAQIQEPYNYFKGAINEARLWARALSADEILGSVVQKTPQNQTGLIGFWDFNAQSAPDRSPVKGNGSYQGVVSFVATDSMPIAAWANYSLRLEGRLPGVATIDPVSPYSFGGDFTVEAWIRTPEAGNGTTVLNMIQMFFGVVSQAIVFDIGPGGSYSAKFVSQTVDNSWHHLAAGRQGDRVFLFVDGASPQQEGQGGDMPAEVQFKDQLVIGGLQPDNGSNMFQGFIDEIRIWGYALSQAQVQQSMHSILSGDEPDLFAYYNFDSINVADRTSRANKGALYGRALIVEADCPVTVPATRVVPAPANLNLAYIVGQLLVSWDRVADPSVQDYEIELTQDTNPPVIQSTPKTSYTYDQTFAPGSTYKIRVKATGTGIQGTWSASYSPLLVAPTNLQLDMPTLSGLTASWTAAADSAVTGYIIELAEGNNPPQSQPVTTTSYTYNQTFSPEATYTIRVRATKANAQGPWTDQLSPLMLAPTNLRFGMKVQDTPPALVATWAAVSVPYSVGYGLELIADSNPPAPFSATAPPYQFPYLPSAGVAYRTRVRAEGAGRKGPWTAYAASSVLRDASYDYDKLGRLKQVTYNAAVSVEYHYDDAGNLVTETYSETSER